MDSFTESERQNGAILLRAFLQEQPEVWEGLCRDAMNVGVEADFTIKSVPKVLQWLGNNIRITRKEHDAEVPEFILKSQTYQSHLFDFDPETLLRIIRGGYYLGQSFISSYQKLSWGLGSERFYGEMLPAVLGFAAKMEMPSIIVVRNIFVREVVGGSILSRTKSIVNYWASSISETSEAPSA